MYLVKRMATQPFTGGTVRLRSVKSWNVSMQRLRINADITALEAISGPPDECRHMGYVIVFVREVLAISPQYSCIGRLQSFEDTNAVIRRPSTLAVPVEMLRSDLAEKSVR